MFGITKFMDLTPEEFTLQNKGFKRAARTVQPAPYSLGNVSDTVEILDPQHAWTLG